MNTYIAAYPWDIIDEGMEAVLDCVQGELGATGLAVWAACPAVLELRAREVEPRMFRTGGGLFFAPTDATYAATRCKPLVAEGQKHPATRAAGSMGRGGKDSFRRIAEACAMRALTVRAIVSAAATGRIARRHPEMACKNALGLASEESVCLSHPDVQTYLCGLMADLSSHELLAGIVLADFSVGWRASESAAAQTSLPLGGIQQRLLALCLCESCHQEASKEGIDAGMVARSVQEHLHQSLVRTDRDGARLRAALADDSVLAEFLRWRGQALSDLLHRLKQACRCDLILDLEAHDGVPEGLDFSIPSAVTTRLDRAEQLGGAWRADARNNELCLSPSYVAGAGDGELVSTLAQATERGFTSVHLEHYGLWPTMTFASIKQAIRFARRTGRE